MTRLVSSLKVAFVLLIFCIFELSAQDVTTQSNFEQGVSLGMSVIGNYGIGVLADYSFNIYRDIFGKLGIDYFFNYKVRSYFGVYVQPEYDLTQIFNLPFKWNMFLGSKLSYFFREEEFRNRFLLDFKLRVHYFITQNKGIFVEVGKNSSLGMVVKLD